MCFTSRHPNRQSPHRPTANNPLSSAAFRMFWSLYPGGRHGPLPVVHDRVQLAPGPRGDVSMKGDSDAAGAKGSKFDRR